ncbi:MAG: hypothetical protein QXT20_00365 [Candidatus Woesearchaeota archaeon]
MSESLEGIVNRIGINKIHSNNIASISYINMIIHFSGYGLKKDTAQGTYYIYNLTTSALVGTLYELTNSSKRVTGYDIDIWEPNHKELIEVLNEVSGVRNIVEYNKPLNLFF